VGSGQFDKQASQTRRSWSQRTRRAARPHPSPTKGLSPQDDKLLLPCARGAPATRREGGGAEQTQDVYIPLKLPLDSARHAPERGVATATLTERRMNDEALNDPCRNSFRWGPDGAGPPRDGATLYCFRLTPYKLTGFSLALCELSCGRACERARLSRVSSHRVSGRRSGA